MKFKYQNGLQEPRLVSPGNVVGKKGGGVSELSQSFLSLFLSQRAEKVSSRVTTGFQLYQIASVAPFDGVKDDTVGTPVAESYFKEKPNVPVCVVTHGQAQEIRHFVGFFETREPFIGGRVSDLARSQLFLFLFGL